MFGQYIDRLLKKKWSDAEIDEYIGRRMYACLAYAQKQEIREGAAAGGSVTSILVYALESKLVDGVLVCKRVVEDGKVRPKFFIATTRDEILSARGSCYVATSFIKEAVPLLNSFAGNLAVVGLPCDISVLSRLCQFTPLLAEKIVVKISLMCGHNSRVELIDEVTKKLECDAKAKIASFSFRTGPWRGRIEAVFDDGRILNLPSSFFTLYQNLYFFSEKKCLFCKDHFGYDADISIGDVWLYRFRTHDVKLNGIIVRTTAGDNVFQYSKKNGDINVLPSSYEEILDGQARVAPFHYNVTARHRAGKLVGVLIPDKSLECVRWNHYLAALIAILNMKWSENDRLAPMIFSMPRPLLKFYLYLFKALESLK